MDNSQLDSALAAKFAIDCEFGFLNKEASVTSLPACYDDLVRIASNMGDLLRQKELRRIFQEANVIPLPNDLSLNQLRKLWTIYGMLSSAYIFSIYEPEVKVLPKALAIPLFELSLQLQIPPILNFDGYVYNNFHSAQGADPCSPESYSPLFTFSSPSDSEHEGEKWFIAVHVAAERAIGPLILRLYHIQKLFALFDDTNDANDALIASFLSDLCVALDSMASIISRMQERLSPASYAITTRKYVLPFVDVVYQGVAALEGGQNLRGETGGQSPVPRAIGAMLGLEHSSKDMADLALHMLPQHREFVALLKSATSLKLYCATHAQFAEQYNSVLAALTRFRQAHLRLVALYLTTHDVTQGTGGSTYNSYLRKNIAETKAALDPN